MSDFYYMSEIIEDLDLESVYITKYMFEGILKALNEKNDYLNDYKISNNNDLKEDEINFYYVLIKYILKNEAYIYNIPFLKKNYDKIIKLKDFFNLKPNYNMISENFVGQHLLEYDSSLVLAHFKGHPLGGFGGAIKQLSIGFASRAGKSTV